MLSISVRYFNVAIWRLKLLTFFWVNAIAEGGAVTDFFFIQDYCFEFNFDWQEWEHFKPWILKGKTCLEASKIQAFEKKYQMRIIKYLRTFNFHLDFFFWYFSLLWFSHHILTSKIRPSSVPNIVGQMYFKKSLWTLLE